MSDRNKDVVSTRAPEPVGAFPHAKRVGDFLFLSGIGPRKRGTKEIPGVALDPGGRIKSYDFEIQCRSTLDNIAAILAEAGLGLEHVVRINAFVTGREHLRPYMDVRNRRFSHPLPASTLMIVSGFARPEFTVEIEVIAAGPAGVA